DDAGARRIIVVHAERGELRQFEERRAGIEQQLHAIARQQLAARGVFLAGFFAAAFGDLRDLALQVLHQRAHRISRGAEVVGTGIELGLEDGHGPDGTGYLAASTTRTGGALGWRAKCTKAIASATRLSAEAIR